MDKRTLKPREGGTLPHPKITRVIEGAPDTTPRPKTRHERRAAIAQMPRDLRMAYKVSKKPKKGLVTQAIINDVQKELKRFERLSWAEQEVFLKKASAGDK